MSAHILIADDEPGIRSFLGEVVRDAGHRVTLASDGIEALALLRKRAYHVLITDLQMPNLGGMELLEHAKREQPELEVIVLTAHGTWSNAVAAMKLGAFDFLAKPVSGPDEVELLVGRALEHRRLAGRVAAQPAASADGFVTAGAAMEPVVHALKQVAPTEASVLLLGESGTGKEVAARAVHRWSPRADGPFVAVNAATLGENLLESELFGHEKGAFTGATAQRRGRVELAEGGTLFLDEIGEMPVRLQAKLLRVLQEGTFERVGGSRTIEADVRWVAATNRDLGAEIREGRFREDLYHRLAVFPVMLPPLRDRLDALPALVDGLLARIGPRVGRSGLHLGDGALERLRAYRWPGNVRELSNALERGAILAGGSALGPQHFVLGIPGFDGPSDGPSEAVTLVEAEREAIRRALAAVGGNRKQTAERLGISERSLYDKLRVHGLS